MKYLAIPLLLFSTTAIANPYYAIAFYNNGSQTIYYALSQEVGAYSTTLCATVNEWVNKEQVIGTLLPGANKVLSIEVVPDYLTNCSYPQLTQTYAFGLTADGAAYYMNGSRVEVYYTKQSYPPAGAATPYAWGYTVTQGAVGAIATQAVVQQDGSYQFTINSDSSDFVY